LDFGSQASQQRIARFMPSLVIHRFESVEIEITKRMSLVRQLRLCHRHLHEAFIAAPVDETRQRVVARLVGHLVCGVTWVAQVAYPAMH
jgi:hypothetical protein